jgi:hypothetical protein
MLHSRGLSSKLVLHEILQAVSSEYFMLAVIDKLGSVQDVMIEQ